MVGKIVGMQLRDHFVVVLLHHQLSFHILLSYLADPSILGSLSSMDKINLQSSFFLLEIWIIRDEGVD